MPSEDCDVTLLSVGKKVLVSHKLVKVLRDGDSWVSVFETSSGKTKQLRSKALVLTSPAYVTSGIVGESGLLPAAEELSNVNYPPVASVTVAYPNDAFKVPLRGFGHLIPRAMKIRTLGTIWSSSLFPVLVMSLHPICKQYDIHIDVCMHFCLVVFFHLQKRVVHRKVTRCC